MDVEEKEDDEDDELPDLLNSPSTQPGIDKQ